MSKIATADCKTAIVQHIQDNPGCVGRLFCDHNGQANTPFKATADGRILPVADFEKPSQKVKNWKRCEKRKAAVNDAGAYKVPVGTIMRTFECSVGDEAQNTYEDQLRAYTYDDGTTIFRVVISGE